MRLDNLAGDMAAVQSALAMGGRGLDVLMQDVRPLRSEAAELRSEMTQVRSGQEAINPRLGMIERNIATIVAAVAPGSAPPA
jgi:hypothetical protein